MSLCLYTIYELYCVPKEKTPGGRPVFVERRAYTTNTALEAMHRCRSSNLKTVIQSVNNICYHQRHICVSALTRLRLYKHVLCFFSCIYCYYFYVLISAIYLYIYYLYLVPNNNNLKIIFNYIIYIIILIF